jgi:hypothetical protein
VANGFAVEIDDRGLGVEAEQLAEINRQLASPPDFDLANADRLGLFVGGKLAARHGVRVALRTSPYGGTTAIVLMPNSIVVPPGTLDGPPADSMEAELAAAARPAGLDLHSGESLAPRRPAPTTDAGLASRSSGDFPGRRGDSSSVPPGPAPALPSRRSATRATSRAASPEAAPTSPAPTSPVTAPVTADPGRSGPLAGRPRLDLPGAGTPGPGSPLPAPPAPGPAAYAPAAAPPAPTRPASSGIDVFRRPLGPDAGGDEPLAGDDGTYHGLPRRTRQASLSPHLRESTLDSGRGSDAGSGLPPEDIPAPEHARNLAASLQSGWRRGRASDPAGRPGPAGVAEPGSPGTTDTPPATTMRAARRQDSEESSNEDG